MRRLKRAHQKYAREQAKRHKKFRQRAVAAGTAAAITLGAGVGINKALAAYMPDEHELPVSQDADADLLANKEELAIGYRVFKPDQNRSEIPDGVELAKRCANVFNQLPDCNEADPDEICKGLAIQYGVETCDICGEVVNMGGAWVSNPRLGLTVYFPILAIHYMEHGSFSYAGDVHGEDRLNMPALLRALELRFPYEPNEHQLPLDYVVEPNGQLAPDCNDLDGDLLADSEELEAGFNLHDADQDEDLAPDGIELAKQCAEIINQLPWEWDALPGETCKWHAPQLGLETCDICGATVNMGSAGIVNPKLGLSVDCPLIAIHYMEHGSFNYAGDIHGSGRIDVATLVKALEIPRRCGDLGTMYLPGDLNEDCEVNFADFAKFADKWLDSTEPSQVGQGEPGMTYQIADECATEGGQMSAMDDGLQFSVTVQGSYIHFEDMMVANCCPDELGLEMTVEDNLITIYETEYTPGGCWCICDYPVTATLGPFEPGTYTLDVYWVLSNDEDMGGFIGSTTVTIGPAG